MKRTPTPEIGKPVQLPADTNIVVAPITSFDNPGCLPPGSDCPTFHIAEAQLAIGLSDVHLLMLQIASPKKQNLDLTIEIATDDYTNLVFMTNTQRFHVQEGNTLVGLDPKAAEAAQPFFVSGNTVTLSVRPRDSGVTVRVGKKVDRGKKAS